MDEPTPQTTEIQNWKIPKLNGFISVVLLFNRLSNCVFVVYLQIFAVVDNVYSSSK